MMKYLIPFLICFLAFQSFAWAQDEEPVITDIREGQSAPFTGTLLNPAAVAQMLAEQEARQTECELRIQYAEDRQQAMCSLSLDSTVASLEALRERYNSILEIKDGEIERLTEIALEADNGDYSQWWFASGIVIGVATTIGIAFAISEIE